MSRPTPKARRFRWVGGLAWFIGWPFIAIVVVYWPPDGMHMTYGSAMVLGLLGMSAIGLGGWFLRPDPDSSSPGLDALDRIAWLFFCLGMGVGITPGFRDFWTGLFGLCWVVGIGLGIVSGLGRSTRYLQVRIQRRKKW